MTAEKGLQLSDTIFSGIDLSLWTGPSAEGLAVSRAIRWEHEVAQERDLPSLGLVCRLEPGDAEAARAMLASIAVCGGVPVSVVFYSTAGIPSAVDLDPRRSAVRAVRSHEDLLAELGVADRVVFSDSADWVGNLSFCAARCDYVGLVRPDCWLQPRGGFALLDALSRSGGDLVISGCIGYDRGTGSRDWVERVSGQPRYSVLGGDALGPCPVMPSSRWTESAAVLAEAGGDAWKNPTLAAWAVGAAALASGAKATRLRLHIWGSWEPAPGGASGKAGTEFFRFLGSLARGLGAGAVKIGVSVGTDEPEVLPETNLSEGCGVGVIIPFRDQEESTLQTLRSLAEQSLVDRMRLVLVDNGSAVEVSERVRIEARRLFGADRALLLREEGPFNFARLNNRGERALPEMCSILVFANNDIEPTDRDDLKRLCSCLAWNDVGLVGGRLVFPDGGIQASGFRLGPAGPQSVRTTDEGAFRFREVDGVGFALAACRRSVFQELNGLDERRCPNGFGDALFCRRARVAGWRILCLPNIVFRHYESKSRGVRPEEPELAELADAGACAGLYFEDLSAEEGVRHERFGKPRPPLHKRIYRACRAFRNEWKVR